MSNDLTQNLPGDDRLDQIITLIQEMGHRLSSLETKVDERLKETRPIWEAVNSRLDSIDARLDGIDVRLNGIDARLDGIDARLDKMDARFDKMDEQFDKMDARMESFEKDIRSGLRMVGYKISALNDNLLNVAAGQLHLRDRVKELESKNS